MYWNKRGMLIETVIFFALNILFFVVLAVFIVNSSSGATVYEQAYAKEIALIIDQAKENTTLTIDFTDALKLAQKNGVKPEEVIQINNLEKKVIVRLGKSGGYSFGYFSNYDILPEEKSGKFIVGNSIFMRIKESKS